MPIAAKRVQRPSRGDTSARPTIATMGFTSAGPIASPAIKPMSARAAGTSLRRGSGQAFFSTLEGGERLDVMGIGEKVEEVEGRQTPTRRGQPARLAREGYGIARQIRNLFFRPLRDRANHFWPCPRARRIEKHEICRR